METTNNRNYTTGIIVAVIVIILIVAAYMFDHRFSNGAANSEMGTSTDMLATSTASTTGSIPTLGTTGSSNPSSNNGASGATSTVAGASSGFIHLQSYTITPKSDMSSWAVYTNSTYKFSLKYPTTNVQVRKFTDGKNVEYGVGFTLPSANSHFTDKYFELTTDTSVTTVCDALLPTGMTPTMANVGGVNFIRNEYNDGASHAIEYTAKVNGVCYDANLRLDGAVGVTAGDLSTAEINTEAQVLEDIMSTFKISK